MPKILNRFQRKALREIGKSELSRFFIWSGGTTLSFQYLHHRLSADLDFMSQDLLPDEYLLSQVKRIAKDLRVKKIEEQKRFNRHEFWLKKDKEILRIEFKIFRWVEKKFGVEIDPVLFDSKALQGADSLNKIKPLILKKELFKPNKIKEYFQEEAENYLKRKTKK